MVSQKIEIEIKQSRDVCLAYEKINNRKKIFTFLKLQK